MAAGTIGMPVPRSMWSASSEQFHTLVLRGVEETAVAEGYSVLSAVVDTLEAEIALIRRWAHQRLVDVVILKDLRRDDPRPRLLRELRMPFVLVGDVRQTGAEAAVLTDNSRSMHVLLEELLALGHHRIAHVGGPGELLHSQWRLGAYVDFMADHALAPSYLEGDYGTASGERCVRALLALEEVPTVIVFDNDAMAIGGADALHRLGVDVPGTSRWCPGTTRCRARPTTRPSPCSVIGRPSWGPNWGPPRSPCSQGTRRRCAGSRRSRGSCPAAPWPRQAELGGAHRRIPRQEGAHGVSSG